MVGRRIAAIAAAAALALTLAACTENRGPGSTPAPTAAANKAVNVAQVDASFGLGKPDPSQCKGKKYTIGYNSFSDTQDYAKSVLKNLKDVASKLGCVKLISLVDNADASTALLNVNTLIQQKVDGVILFQIVASAQEGIMNRLNAAGIPAVAHAVPAPGAPFVAPSDRTAGQTGGEALAKAAQAKKVDPKKAYLVLGVAPSTGAVSDNRLGGVQDAVLKAMPDIPPANIIKIDGGGVADTSLARMTETLASIPAGSTIMFSAINDDAVGGMYRAVQQAGRQNDAIAVGMGGLYPSGVQAVCDNPSYVGTVDFLPETAGTYLLPAILSEINGKKIPETVFTPVKLLDRAAAHQKYPDLSCG